MKSSWRSPDGGSSVAPNTKIEPSEAVFRAWWSTASTPIRSFHTVSEGEFSEVRIYGVLRSSQAPLRGSGDVLPKPEFSYSLGRGILGSSDAAIAAWHTKIRHLGDAPSTSSLLTWRCYVTRDGA